MPSYTIHYFNIRGLVEGWRLLLEDAGVPYKEVRFGADWAEKKGEYLAKGIITFHQIPVIEIDGTYYTQSSATSRFLSKALGYYGGDANTQYHCDAIDDAVCKDWRAKYGKIVYPVDEAKQAEYQQKYIEGDLKKYLGIFESCLSKQEKGEYFIAGKDITFADFTLWEMLDASKTMSKSCLDSYPLLSAYYLRIASRPNIKLASGKRPAKINNSIYGSGN